MTLSDRLAHHLAPFLSTVGASLQRIHLTDSQELFLIIEIPASLSEGTAEFKKKLESSLKTFQTLTKVHITFTAQRRAPLVKKTEIPGVTYVLAIASGKGGVGKSTTAVNLAFALHEKGLTVGLLDADIYGPSLPRLLGSRETPLSEDGKSISPLVIHGLKAMSMGFLTEKEGPAIWRGPMVQKALQHLLRNVNWGPLDVLIVDLPPGTGDVHLTLTQTVPLSGVILISTPQDLALADTRKGFQMFQKMDVPVLGFIENMSYFLCPHCETRSHIFTHGGVREEAQKQGFPLLAEIPLQIAICKAAEEGMPFGLQNPAASEASLYKNLAERVWTVLSGGPSC